MKAESLGNSHAYGDSSKSCHNLNRGFLDQVVEEVGDNSGNHSTQDKHSPDLAGRGFVGSDGLVEKEKEASDEEENEGGDDLEQECRAVEAHDSSEQEEDHSLDFVDSAHHLLQHSQVHFAGIRAVVVSFCRAISSGRKLNWGYAGQV